MKEEGVTKILFLANTFGPGSGPLQRASVFDRDRYKVDLIAFYGFEKAVKGASIAEAELRDKYNECFEYIKETGLSFNCMDASSWHDLSALFNLYRVLKKNKYDVIVAHHFFMGIAGTMVAKLAGKSIVVKVEMSELWRASFFARLMTAITYLFVDHVVCISQCTADSMSRWQKYISGNIRTVIYNGLNLEYVSRFKSDPLKTRKKIGVSTGDFIFFHAGRLHPVKHQSLMVEAFSLVRKKNERAHLVIAGTGPEERNLKELAKKLGVESAVHFQGFVDRDTVYDFLSASDSFLMTSHSEGFSEALLQAMAFELPVIAVDIPSFTEALDNEESGVIVPRDAQLYAEAMGRMINDKQLRHKVRINAKKRVTDLYDIKKIIKDYEELFHKKIWYERI